MKKSPRVVVLVPIRYGIEERDRLWRYTKPLLKESHPDWEIFEGHHNGGPFNRAEAINRAAEAAGEWDVAFIIDNDVVFTEVSVEAAVKLAYDSGGVFVAHDERFMLNQQTTEHILNGDAGYEFPWNEKSMIDNLYTDSVSCGVAVPRAAWDAVGGFDPLFVGWGFEDTSFRVAVETKTGIPFSKVTGRTYHLWHPTADEAKDWQHPLRVANQDRMNQYIAAHWDPDKVDQLLREVEVVRAGSSARLSNPTIPAVFHRTIPTEISAEAERFWEEFQALHPGWEFRTYQEPIDPADWPIVGEYLDLCQNGAQRAGLIRLEALWTYGGIYVDSDVKPFKSFEPLLTCQAFVGWEDHNVAPDAVLGAVAGHPAWKIMLELAVAAVKAGEDAHKSGPSITTKVLPYRADVLALPPGAFYPFHYLDLGQRDADHGPAAFCAHQWAGSWLSEDQRATNESRQQRRPSQRPTTQRRTRTR